MQLLIWRSFLKRSNSKKEILSRRVLVWEEWRWGDIVQKVQIFSYEQNKFWGSNVEQGEYKILYCILEVCLKSPGKWSSQLFQSRFQQLEESARWAVPTDWQSRWGWLWVSVSQPATHLQPTCAYYIIFLYGADYSSCKFLSTGFKISWS